MVDVTFISHVGERATVSAGEGVSVMQAALDNGVNGILADCGGALSCATCHVHVVPEWFERAGAPSAAEADMLEMAVDPDETSRLSCQIVLGPELDGLEVILPATQL